MAKEKALPDLADVSRRSGIAEDVLLHLRTDSSWDKAARCRDRDPELLFRGGQRKVPSRVQALCAGCTVRSLCLLNKSLNDERYGHWAGTNQRLRRAFLKSAQAVAEEVSLANLERAALLDQARSTR